MEPTTLIFYAFALILVLSALKVITARNPVHSALFLVLAFFTAAGIWMMLQAEFLALALILVYVGAVMVLFLFVVMMLDINLDKLRRDFWTYVPMATLIGAVIVAEMTIVLIRGFIGTDKPVQVAQAAGSSNTKELGKAIFVDYIYAFEVAGIILLVAIIAAVALTLRRRKDSKTQDVPSQIRTRSQDRLRIVSMPAESTRQADSADTKN